MKNFVFVKSLFRFFHPFLRISALFKGLLPCETIGTFGTFRYLSYLRHFWTIWAILDHFGPFLNNSMKTDWPPLRLWKFFIKFYFFLNDGFPYPPAYMSLFTNLWHLSQYHSQEDISQDYTPPRTSLFGQTLIFIDLYSKRIINNQWS